MRTKTGPTPRPGYTLIELLIVIAIIAIVASLTLVAVFKVGGKGGQTTAVSEINQLDMAATSYQNTYKVYPPSQVLFLVGNNPNNPALRGFMFPHRTDMPDFQVFKRMYSRWLPNSTDMPMLPDGVTIDLATLGGPPPTGRGRADYVALVQQTNTFVNPAARPLDPNQMMVLFLGGPGALFDPNNTAITFPTTHGWDTVGPFVPLGNNKHGPFYEFKTSRQYDGATGVWDARFRDPWGTPYAYFNALNADNYHDARGLQLNPQRFLVAKFPWDTSAPILATDTYDPMTDPLPTKTVHPLAVSIQGSVVKWVNPGRIQVISAGRDRIFGAGTFQHATLPPTSFLWKAGQGTYGTAEPGDDDLANFNDGNVLGTPGGQ